MVAPLPPNEAPREDDSTELRRRSESPARAARKKAEASKRAEVSRRDEESATITTQPSLRLHSDDVVERAAVLSELAVAGGYDSFNLITRAFDDPASEVRNAAARALYELRADRSSSFITAFQEAFPERRRRIAGAMADSGLAAEEIVNLDSENRDVAYDAFALLFLMAKAGEVAPLIRAVEDSPSIDVRQTLIQLLAQCGQTEVLPAFSRLAVRQSLPSEVRSALMEAIHQLRFEQLKALPAVPLMPGTAFRG